MTEMKKYNIVVKIEAIYESEEIDTEKVKAKLIEEIKSDDDIIDVEIISIKEVN